MLTDVTLCSRNEDRVRFRDIADISFLQHPFVIPTSNSLKLKTINGSIYLRN